MDNRVCLITGATEGVGRATAVQLAAQGVTVVLAARDANKAEALAREIATLTGNNTTEYVVGDLASLQQTRALAERFKSRHSRLDVLINNAGVFLPKRTVTGDGFETTFQVNYLSHVLLTQLLLETLEQSAQGRIINLSSSVYSGARFDPTNLQSEHKFSVFGTYAASKLLVLMFTEELAARLAGTRVTANAMHPGIVRTRMMLKAPGAFRIISYLWLPFSISPHKGARTAVHLATSPDLARVSGHYFTRSRQTATKNKFDTPENRALLWRLTMQTLNLNDAASTASGAS